MTSSAGGSIALPTLAVRLLVAVLPPEEREMILGDLAEVYGDRVLEGRRATRLWFWGQALMFAARFGAERRRERVAARRAVRRRKARHPSASNRARGNWDMRDLLTRFRQTVRRLTWDWRYAGGVVLILGVGIGPAAAMFSVVQKVLLEPLPYAEPEELGIVRIDLGEIRDHPGLSLSEIQDLRAVEGLFSAVEGTSREFEMSLADGEELVPASATSVSPGLFDMLGVSPILGRHFSEDDVEESRVILSHGMWQTRFGGDPEIVGRTITLNGRATEVIGVMPPGFGLHTGRGSQLSTHVDLWLPLEIRDFRNFWGFPTLVRLDESVSFAQANERLVPFAQGLTERFPEHYAGTSLRYVVHPLLPDLVREARPVIQAALAGVLLLLVIAVSNATALVVARLKSREIDLAIRSAMGAGRRALVSDALIESVLLSACGAALGGSIASAGIAALRTFIPRTVPRWDTITLGWDLLGYSAGLALLGLLLAGIVPAWKASQGAPWETLRGVSRGGSSRAPTRLVLVGTQIAMAVVLTFGAIQLARSAMRLAAAELGFDAHVLALRVPFDFQRFGERPEQAALYQRIRDRLSELPGVHSVGAISHLPLSGTGPVDAYTPNLADSASMDQAMANYFAVLPGYLETMRVALRQGRYFSDAENVSGDSVIIIDETLAAAAFPGVDPIGRWLRLGWGLPNSRVVGVVSHARVIDVSQEVRPQIYVPYGRFPWGPLHFTVRTEGDPLTFVALVRDAVRELGTGRAVSHFQLLSENVTTATSALRSVTIMVSLLAVSAALLCALGLYAVVSYIVHQRRRATAIRGALGATPRRLLGYHLRNGIAVVAVAVPVGMALSLVAARLYGSLVYEIGVRDVRSLGVAAALAAVTGLVGTYFPARRAANEDPVQALRSE